MDSLPNSGDTVEELRARIDDLEMRLRQEHGKAEGDAMRMREVEEILHSMSDIVFILRPDSTIRTINKATAKLLGATIEDVEGASLVRYLAPSSLKARTWSQLLSESQVSDLILNLVSRDGLLTEVCFNGSVLRDNAGRITGTVCVGRDTREMKRTLEDLVAAQAEERKYRQLMSDLAVGCVVIAEGRIRFANQSFAGLVGVPSSESLISKEIASLVHQEDHEVLQNLLSSSGANKRGPQPLRIHASTGTTRYASVFSNGASLDGVDASQLVFVDETDLHDARERQGQLRKELETASRMATIGQLAGGIAHEINNPLQIIQGYVDLLQLDELNDSQSDYLNQIWTATNRCRDIVRKVLTFSREPDSQIGRTDVNSAIRDATNFLESQLALEDCELELDLLDPLPPACMGEGILQQILFNLLTNARDAMPGGGTIHISSRLDGGFIHLQVQDTGEGMDEKTIESIFDPFFTTKNPGKGTGLGMSIVFGLVSSSGGHIRVDSVLDKGSTISLQFPVAELLPSSDEAVQPQSIRFRPLRVLITDDEKALRQLCRSFLLSSGHFAVEARCGEEAVDLVQREPFDLILMDLKMPGMGGVAAIESIRMQNKDIPILVATGQVEPGISEQLRALGVMGTLRKPFKLAELKTHLERLVPPPCVVLIVDDDEVIRLTAAKALGELDLGLQIQHAKDGFEAGRYIERFVPEFILLDLYMPGISGFDICKDIKSSKRSRGCTVIAMTTSSDPDILDQILKAGADFAFRKPLDFKQIQEVIRKSKPTRF